MPNYEKFTFADDTPPKPAPAKKEPAQLLLDFLQRWNKPTVRMNEILVYGPTVIRKKEHALNSTKVLVDHGWLIPVKTRRPDMLEWQIVRRPIAHPTIAA